MTRRGGRATIPSKVTTAETIDAARTLATVGYSVVVGKATKELTPKCLLILR
jgi:hypothetical protein